MIYKVTLSIQQHQYLAKMAAPIRLPVLPLVASPSPPAVPAPLPTLALAPPLASVPVQASSANPSPTPV